MNSLKSRYDRCQGDVAVLEGETWGGEARSLIRTRQAFILGAVEWQTKAKSFRRKVQHIKYESKAALANLILVLFKYFISVVVVPPTTHSCPFFDSAQPTGTGSWCLYIFGYLTQLGHRLLLSVTFNPDPSGWGWFFAYWSDRRLDSMLDYLLTHSCSLA